MNRLIDTRFEWIKRTAYGTFAFALPFCDWSSVRFSSILIVLFCCLAVISIFTRSGQPKLSFYRHFLILSAPFLIQLISLFQGGDGEMIASGLMIKLPFLLFPFLIAILGSNHEDWTVIKRFFVMGCVVAVLFSLRFLADPDMRITQISEHQYFEKYFVLHRPYFGIYLLVAIVFLLDKTLPHPYHIGAILFFVLFLGFIQAKMVFVILIFTGLMYLVSRLKQSTQKWVAIIFFGISLVLLFFLLQFYHMHKQEPDRLSSRARFFVLSVNTRLIHWDCAIDIFRKNIWVGTGEGNIKQAMNQCYASRYPDEFQFVNNFNVHNEWLEEFVRHGLTGGVIYGLCFFLIFRMSMRAKNKPYQAFLIIVIMASLTETIFSRSQGVLMIAFFNTLLYFRSMHQQEEDPSLDRINEASAAASVGSK